MDYKDLRKAYLGLKTWKEYVAFRKEHPNFDEIPFDVEMKMKFNELAQSEYTPTAFDNPMCHMELKKKE